MLAASATIVWLLWVAHTQVAFSSKCLRAKALKLSPPALVLAFCTRWWDNWLQNPPCKPAKPPPPHGASPASFPRIFPRPPLSPTTLLTLLCRLEKPPPSFLRDGRRHDGDTVVHVRVIADIEVIKNVNLIGSVACITSRIKVT